MPPTSSSKAINGPEPSTSASQPQHRHQTSLPQTEVSISPKPPVPKAQQQTFQEKKEPREGSLAHDPGPKDFHLIVEATKKAQLAVLMRDMADVEL